MQVKTLKQRRFLKAIADPKNRDKPLKKIALENGYTSQVIYRDSIRKHIQELFSKQGITKESMQDYFNKLSDLAISTSDITNANRSGENLAKTAGLFTDRAIVSQDIQLTTQEQSILDKLSNTYKARLSAVLQGQSVSQVATPIELTTKEAGQG